MPTATEHEQRPIRPWFLLGTHHPGWLATAGIPLFVSDRRLRGYRRLPRAAAGWALDSGGFTELASHGSWEHAPTPAQYVARVRRYAREVGRLAWAAPQDWMCEPFILAKTGRTVSEHQARTVANYQRLRALDPELPFVPVLQGWRVGDYLRCADRYAAAGIDLTREPLVALGSVCRRQATGEAEAIITALRSVGLTCLHGFGVKTLGLARYGHLLHSADSMAWSVAARRSQALPGCTRHRTCSNCPRYALAWRQRLLTQLRRGAGRAEQLPLFTAMDDDTDRNAG
ncbi:MAG TPA: hypothetical protein VGL39_28180 [Jatrophihabitantaceae bacterium]|jgi:hypothetical protein